MFMWEIIRSTHVCLAKFYKKKTILQANIMEIAVWYIVFEQLPIAWRDFEFATIIILARGPDENSTLPFTKNIPA